jgi:TonB family protein
MFPSIVLIFWLGVWSTNQPQSVGNGPTVKRIVGLTYPRLAQLAGVQGKVELVATVSRDGKVRRVRALEGSGLLAPAAQEAVSKWLFVGCTANEACEAKIFFSFVLRGQCELPNCSTEFQMDLPDRVEVRSAFARAIVN